MERDERMARREPYKGYVLRADPVRRGARWVAQVVIELHLGTTIIVCRLASI